MACSIATQSLNIPDFRASETVFQLITQVAGRSGRGVAKGEVIIQTAVPDNSTIQHASKQNYPGFYEEEIAIRELFRYPPFLQMAKLMFSGPKAEETMRLAEEIRGRLVRQLPDSFEINPVIPCGHAKIKDNYRYQFLMRASRLDPLQTALASIQEHVRFPSTVKMFIDINPSSTFF